jgi:ribonuclease HI
VHQLKAEVYQDDKRGSRRVVWSPAARGLYDEIRERLRDAKALAPPRRGVPFEVYTDASAAGLGAVLVQEGRAVQFASVSLGQDPVYAKLAIRELEVAAMLYAMRAFHPLVYGAEVIVYTDSANAVTALRSLPGSDARYARAVAALQEYRVTTRRVPTDRNPADSFSRWRLCHGSTHPALALPDELRPCGGGGGGAVGATALLDLGGDAVELPPNAATLAPGPSTTSRPTTTTSTSTTTTRTC